MSDPLPPPQPPLPPPPPLPPAPPGYAPVAAPVIRWGTGDLFWGLLLYLVGGVVASVVLIATGAIDVDSVANDGTTELGVGAIAVSLLGGWLGFVGWPIVATLRKGQRSLRRDFGLDLRPIDAAWGVLGGVVAIGVAILGGVVWKGITGDDPPSNGEFLPDNPAVPAGIALWVLVAVLTPIAEELFFRGLALRAIGRRWGLPVGVVASSLLFGALHFDASGGPGHGLFIVGVTALYGAVFAWLVVRAEGRLGPAIVAHACVNTVGILSLYLS